MTVLRSLSGALALLATASLFAATESRTQIDSGIVLDVTLSAEGEALVEGDLARVTVKLSDKATKAPLRGVFPAAWLGAIPARDKGERERCTSAIGGYLSGSLLTRAELDLNIYYVAAMNADGTITVVDPRFSFGGTRLLAMVQLKGPGEDWVLSADGGKLFVSVPKANEVAVIDTTSWEIVANVSAGAKPGRVMLPRDSDAVWVAVERGVAAIGVRDSKVVTTIETGGGAHDLVVSDDGKWLFVTNGEEGTVAIVDAHARRLVATLPATEKPVSIAWSLASRQAYVAGADGKIAVIDPATGKRKTVIETDPGVRQIRFSRDGRFGFVVNPEKDLISIVDTATDRVMQRGIFEGRPFDVAFTDTLAYVRHEKNEIVLMVPLADLGRPGRQISVVDFPAGQEPFGKPSGAADGIVPAPGEFAVLVAHPVDKTIYYYREGMAAPVGHFTNYGRAPRAVLPIDRTLREKGPGLFTTTARLPRAGKYNVAVLIDSPRAVACFEVTVQSSVRDKGPKVEQLTSTRVVAPGSTVRTAFRLSDRATAKPIDGLADASALIYRVSSGWNERRPLRAAGDGKYEAEFTLPQEGIYYVFVESATAGLKTNNPDFLVLEAK